VLTASGVVLGQYELFDGSIDEGLHAFYWSESLGFEDLGSLVNGGLSAAEWQNLLNADEAAGMAADGSPVYIAADGNLAGETDDGTAFLLTENVVPEPGAGALLVAGCMSFGVRRRFRRVQR